MPRKAEWPPKVYHHPSGRERIKVEGKAYYLGPIGSPEARARYNELVEHFERHRAQQTPARKARTLTVAEVVEQHFYDAQKRYDPRGREARQFDYSVKPMLSLFAALPVDRFGLAELRKVRDEMVRLQWCRNVVARRVVRIRTLFRWAERHGLTPPGTWAALSALEPLSASDKRVRSSERRKTPEWLDFAKVCRSLPTTVRDMMLVQLFAGLRSAEVRTIRPREIDRRNPEAWVYRPAQHKNEWRGHAREIALGPRAKKVLARYLEGKPPDEYVFVSGWDEGGVARCYTDCSYPRAVARACQRVGVPTMTPYSLRKLASIRAVRAGSLDHARSMLGHRSVATTAQYYTDGADMALASDVARKVG
jgi:integrase